jgi:hypothetical protein
MELIITAGFPNGQVSLKCESFDEAESARNWLIAQGLLQGTPTAQAQQNASNVVDMGAVREERDAAAEQAAAQAELEAEQAAQAAAKPKRTVKKNTEPTPEATIQDVTKAVTDYAAKMGPAEARALFSRFGVTRGGDLKPAQFDEFVKVARDYTARGFAATSAEMPEGAESAESLM